MQVNMNRTRLAAILCGLLALTAPAQAAYPDRLITIVCASGAGGAVDVTTRVFADYLAKAFNQTVLVQNEPGAGSTIAITNVARANPDGYTLLTIGSGVAVASELYPNANVDVLRDLVPVTMVGATPLVLYVNGTVPAKTYGELITWLKAHPSDATSGSNGRGSAGHLSIELLNAMAGVNIRPEGLRGRDLGRHDGAQRHAAGNPRDHQRGFRQGRRRPGAAQAPR
jgi:tripartite-type tricarboxylate transporter receptor subunit TctC